LVALVHKTALVCPLPITAAVPRVPPPRPRSGGLRREGRRGSHLGHTTPHSKTEADLWAEIDRYTVELLTRAQREGILAPDADADADWTRQVYYAHLSEALDSPGTDQDPAAQDHDALAALVIDTLLHGAGPHD
jgi:hypothetical protein